MNDEISSNELTLASCFNFWRDYFVLLIKEIEGEDDGNRRIKKI